MGTTYNITVGRRPAGLTRERLQQEVQDTLDTVNRLMSTYDPESEISRFNRQRSTTWFSVSAVTLDVIGLALDIAEQSDGAFDITVGALVDLWGFGPSLHERVVPPDADIAAARARSGYRKLQIRRQPPAIRKLSPGLQLDLSGIAKGYGVDAVAEYLASQGVKNYLVEIGGEIRSKGLNQRGLPWRIAIERPVPGTRQVETVIRLQNDAMATSGNYRNFFEVDGVRYSHTIDPRSGRPVTHKLASVTVLNPRTAVADAWATALMVVGTEEAKRLADAHALPVLLISQQGKDYVEWLNDAFRLHVVHEESAETYNNNK